MTPETEGGLAPPSLVWASRLLAAGVNVIPLRPRDKRPAVRWELFQAAPLIERDWDELDAYLSYPLLCIATDDGESVRVHAFHTVAKRELSRLRPVPGDRIGIKYVGKDEERGYEKYRVVLERPQAEASPKVLPGGGSRSSDKASDVERTTGFEPATPTLARWCSTN